MASAPGDDLRVPPGPGLPHGLTIPAGDLAERFSRASGPGGQGVNTTDSRVELLFDPGACAALTEDQRARIRVGGRSSTEGQIRIVAAEHRSQQRNRVAARVRLVQLLQDALAPSPPARRPTRPTGASRRRRLEAKSRRALLKAGRGRPPVPP